MYSICVLLPYFLRDKGHWPEYIDWHFASAKANSSVDFYIFTDDHSILKWAEADNINIINMTFEDCVDLIHKKLGDVKIDKPYKLCDYRPAYGVIFEDYIKNYDFWGWCDCDLIFGNIREFFPDKTLEKYDKLMVLGQLQLSKNTKEVNAYYKLDRPEGSRNADFSWEMVSGTFEHQGYDEGTGVPMLVRENAKPILWDLKAFSNIYQPVKNGRHMYDKIIDKNDVANRPFQYWVWRDGGLYHIDALTKKKTAKLYIHFTERKLKFEPYNNQKMIYVSENSELKSTISFKDTVAGFDFLKVISKKIVTWIKWKLTHHGKKRVDEM